MLLRSLLALDAATTQHRCCREPQLPPTCSHIMPCAAEELCKLHMTCEPPDGHACRGSCGGRLHGICSEVEDPDDVSQMHRICHSCVTKKTAAAPPSHSELLLFVPLEQYTGSSGMSKAGYYRRKANMSFFAAQPANKGANRHQSNASEIISR